MWPASSVDANEGLTAEVYAELAPHLVRLGVTLVEQPLPAGGDDMLARSSARCRSARRKELPLTGRASRDSLAGTDMVNIKLDKTGGLTEAIALRRRGQGGGLRHHGGFDGRLVAGDGAGAAGGTWRGFRRS